MRTQDVMVHEINLHDYLSGFCWNLLHASWKQIILTFDAAAASIILETLSQIASLWTLILSVVDLTIECWTAATYIHFSSQ